MYVTLSLRKHTRSRECPSRSSGEKLNYFFCAEVSPHLLQIQTELTKINELFRDKSIRSLPMRTESSNVRLQHFGFQKGFY